MDPTRMGEGFLDGPNQNYHWERDGAQVNMLRVAQSLGANIFEAISYSPPYWMTVSQCASGSVTGKTDNLDPLRYGDYVLLKSLFFDCD